MRALILEDNQQNARLFQLCTESFLGLDVDISSTYGEFSERLEETAYDLFVVDNFLPDTRGLDVISELRSKEEHAFTPIIMITADDDRETRIQALESGATDFLTKPIDSSELVARIRNMIALREYHHLLKAENENLEKLATTDSLMEVWNRRSFMDRLQREIQRAYRFDHTLTVAMMDADHFKNVNDTHGHLVGDQVLVGIAQAAKSRLRDIDIVGRLGGEEFAICMAQTPEQGGETVANRIREDIEALSFSGKHGSLRITTSMSIAEWRRGESATDLLDRADKALYEAKTGGRNLVFVSAA